MRYTISRVRVNHENGYRDVEPTAEVQFEEIYRITYQKTLAYVRRRTVGTPDALDVVAETYLVAWRRLDVLLAADQPQAYLYGIANRCLLNLKRSHRRRDSLIVRAAQAEAGRLNSDPAESVEASEELIVVLAAMEQLSEYDRELLRMAAYEELTHTQIAVALETQPMIVRGALFRARRRLQRAVINMSNQRISSFGHKHEDSVDGGNQESSQ